MMDAINIVFRFIDFFVIIGIGFYAMKKYILPTVKEMLRERGVFLYNLESDCKKLKLQARSIHENIQDQEREYQAMQVRFVTWQKKCDELVALKKAEQQQVDESMKSRFDIRSDYIKNDRIVKEQLPGILDISTQMLQKKYHGTDSQKQYIDELIHVMKEQS
jgi:hypothetical protein